MARPWIDYLARCSAVLSAGEPAVDVAVFVGEEAPVTGLFDDALDTAVPPGFDFDYVGADGLALLRADGEELRSAGARYRLLYLGGSSRRMTVAALRRSRGAARRRRDRCRLRPESSPSLADDDVEFAGVCDRIWALPRARARRLDGGSRRRDARARVAFRVRDPGGPAPVDRADRGWAARDVPGEPDRGRGSRVGRGAVGGRGAAARGIPSSCGRRRCPGRRARTGPPRSTSTCRRSGRCSSCPTLRRPARRRHPFAHVRSTERGR